MSSESPVEVVWTGDVFRPVSPYWGRRADKQFARGEVLRIVHVEERSTASHQHFFAVINEAHASLPPLLAERFNSPEALRKYALVKSGHCYSDSVTCPSHADALRVASFTRNSEEFCVVTVVKNVVTRYRPKSMSYREMPKAEFKQAKDDVLRVISELLGVAKQELSDAGKAA